MVFRSPSSCCTAWWHSCVFTLVHALSLSLLNNFNQSHRSSTLQRLSDHCTVQTHTITCSFCFSSSRSGTRCADPRPQSCPQEFYELPQRVWAECVAGGRDGGRIVQSKLFQHRHRVWISCDVVGVSFRLLWIILSASFTFLLLQLQ